VPTLTSTPALQPMYETVRMLFADVEVDVTIFPAELTMFHWFTFPTPAVRQRRPPSRLSPPTNVRAAR
jgi:hypothetical protein